MGRKRSRKGQRLFCYLALATVIFLGGCTLLEQVARERDVEEKLALGQQFKDQGLYDQSLKIYSDLAAAYPQTPPGDLALKELATVLIHPGRPQKQYREALEAWTKLLKNFPQSPYAAEARSWVQQLSEYLELLQQSEKDRRLLLQARDQSEECRAKLEDFKQDQKNVALDLIARNQRLMTHKDFDKVLEENQTLLARSGNKPPADEALYALGLTYANRENPKHDYLKALGYFNRLLREFPRSWRAEEARVWIRNIETLERAKQIDLEIEARKKRLRK